jgi:hypothetical protein
MSDDFCCEGCTEIERKLRTIQKLKEAAFRLQAALLVREAEDYLKEMAS